MEWNIRISKKALSTLQRWKLNASQLLPITNDLVKLSKYIDTDIGIMIEKFTKDQNNAKWNRLATLVLSRIILFNKRRSGEASKMRMSDYISRPLWKHQNTTEIRNSLTPIERKLAEILTIVEIEGRRGRPVPLILTPLVKESFSLISSSYCVWGLCTLRLYKRGLY